MVKLPNVINFYQTLSIYDFVLYIWCHRSRVQLFIFYCSKVIKRRLELNWFNEDSANHKVVLYDSDPTQVEDAKEILVLDPAFHKDGFFLTSIQLEKPTSEELG